jgi:hypothetical protein
LNEIEKCDYKAELLSDVISCEEDDPDVMKTIFTAGGELRALKVASKVPLPADTEALRHRVILLGTAWLFISFHQTNRSSLVGLSPQLFQQYLAYLLGEHVHGLLLRDGRGTEIQAPAWHLLITYEFSVRKKATDLMRRGTPFAHALRQAWECPMTKERYFSTPLAMDTVARRPIPQQPRYQPQEPAFKKPKIEEEGKGAGKGKKSKTQRKKDRQKLNGKTSQAKSAASEYTGKRVNPDGKPMCFKFNSSAGCLDAKCTFQHACGGCFKHNVSMKNCPQCKRSH